MGPFIIDHSFHFRHLLKRQLGQLNNLVALFILIIGLQCYNAQETSSLRLVNGVTPNEGRVEVDLGDGRGWGTICDNGWDYHDATVVCKQIGYPAATFSTLGARFGGNPSLPILLENVACDATHSRIDECPSAILSASCDHTKDAGVKCMVPGFLGCYTLLEIGSRTWTLLDNSNDLCITHCKDLNYHYAGMSGSSCTCGNNHRFYFYNQYPDSYCNSNCKGDATQLCGNTVLHYFSVFDTTLGVCEDPGVPQNGNRSGDNFAFSSEVTFFCHDDHVLVGDPTLQCVLGDSPHDVRWSATPPQCVSVRLPPATNIPDVRNSTSGDITIGLMTSSENPSTLQNSQILSSGTIAGIAVVISIIVIAVIVLTVLYVFKKKKEAKARAVEFQPEEINKRSESIENVYDIDESNVLEDETDTTPSPVRGRAGDARNHTEDMANGHTPRALPSIHLYADVTLPRDELISPTSDYGTMDNIRESDDENSSAHLSGDRVGGGTERQDEKRYYFVLESPVANDRAIEGQRLKQKPKVKARAPTGRFIKKPPRSAPKNIKTANNQVTSATNVLHENHRSEHSTAAAAAAASLSESTNSMSGEGAVSEQSEESFQNEPQSPKYINSEFHDVPKNLIENTLYKPSDSQSIKATAVKVRLPVPKPKPRMRNNSESEATPKAPPHANSDAKRRRSTGEPEGTTMRSDRDDSPCYINTEFHAVPDNMIDNQLYKPCTPGQIDSLNVNNSHNETFYN